MTTFRLVALAALLVGGSVQAKDRIVTCGDTVHASRIRSLVQRGIEGNPEFSFTHVPGDGSPERGWAIYQSANRWILRSVRLRSVVWGNEQWSIPREEGSGWVEKQLKVQEVEVDPGFVGAVEDAFRLGLSLRTPVPSDIVLLDGPVSEFTFEWECAQFFTVDKAGRVEKLLAALRELEAAPWFWTNAGKRRSVERARLNLVDFAK